MVKKVATELTLQCHLPVRHALTCRWKVTLSACLTFYIQAFLWLYRLRMFLITDMCYSYSMLCPISLVFFFFHWCKNKWRSCHQFLVMATPLCLSAVTCNWKIRNKTIMCSVLRVQYRGFKETRSRLTHTNTVYTQDGVQSVIITTTVLLTAVSWKKCYRVYIHWGWMSAVAWILQYV